ncbi:hypothetical protein HPB50_019462 [Hyalomma asiaticum]|uniref:Uncharacterized protein n=1 Tax=Hyalomma asiaticum TaxID=266040 RepID=A0ACB7T706_HYAAI|nr:hypothetical protein HPB50_019462 [Hyalomma asiaticum]
MSWKPTIAAARIAVELRDLQIEPLQNVSAGLAETGDIYNWIALIIGPENTPYEGGLFKMKIEIGENYPFVPPRVTMVTPVYHPNFVADFPLCLDVLQRDWSPAMTVTDVLLSVVSLMGQPDLTKPSVTTIARLYSEDIELYNATARLWTRTYANE